MQMGTVNVQSEIEDTIQQIGTRPGICYCAKVTLIWTLNFIDLFVNFLNH